MNSNMGKERIDNDEISIYLSSYWSMIEMLDCRQLMIGWFRRFFSSFVIRSVFVLKSNKRKILKKRTVVVNPNKNEVTLLSPLVELWIVKKNFRKLIRSMFENSRTIRLDNLVRLADKTTRIRCQNSFNPIKMDTNFLEGEKIEIIDLSVSSRLIR